MFLTSCETCESDSHLVTFVFLDRCTTLCWDCFKYWDDKFSEVRCKGCPDCNK